MHETGHLWLDELMRDAKIEQAVQGLKDDAGAERKWLGAAETAEITRAPREKVASCIGRIRKDERAPNKAQNGIKRRRETIVKKVMLPGGQETITKTKIHNK